MSAVINREKSSSNSALLATHCRPSSTERYRSSNSAAVSHSPCRLSSTERNLKSFPRSTHRLGFWWKAPLPQNWRISSSDSRMRGGEIEIKKTSQRHPQHTSKVRLDTHILYMGVTQFLGERWGTGEGGGRRRWGECCATKNYHVK